MTEGLSNTEIAERLSISEKGENSDVEIDNALAEQKRSMSEDDFQRQLTDRGLAVDDLRMGLRRELSAQKLIEREVTSRIAVTDEDGQDVVADDESGAP